MQKLFKGQFIWLGIMVLSLAAGCHRANDTIRKEPLPKVPVTVAGIKQAILTDYIELTAISAFMDKAVIKAVSNGYIEKVFINPGESVRKGQIIFTLKTKEARALENDSLNPLSFSGLIRIKAAIDGVVFSVDHPTGDYVQDGDQLCVISEPRSLVFILEAPYEDCRYVITGLSCQILLSDGQMIEGHISSRLPAMTGDSQTQRFIIHPITTINLPENLIAKVRIIRKTIPDATLLPKSCVLTDEVMKHFWVMRLVGDSLAVKVTVKTGLTEGDDIEIIDPVFNISDLFLASGNYGLGDTAYVVVTGKIMHE
jgi:multidrug efflux pump subunit AcrA (membrane-fusion protein)